MPRVAEQDAHVSTKTLQERIQQQVVEQITEVHVPKQQEEIVHVEEVHVPMAAEEVA